MVLFAALAIFGPDRNPVMIAMLCALGAFQVIEPRLPLLSIKGSVLSFALKLVLCYILIGWTEGIASSYYWVLLLPAVSAATLGLVAIMITCALAIGAAASCRQPADRARGGIAWGCSGSDCRANSHRVPSPGHRPHRFARSR